MTRMTRPDCAVMCNFINTHTRTHTHRKTESHWPEGGEIGMTRENAGNRQEGATSKWRPESGEGSKERWRVTEGLCREIASL